MLVGIIYSTEKNVMEKLVEGLKKGMEEQGVEVRLYPDTSDTFIGLAACKLLFVGTYAPTIFKIKTPSRLKDVINRAGGMVGKRSVAFTPDAGSRGRKALLALMNDMERQGCFIIDQLSFRTQKEAYQYGVNLKIRE